MMPASNTAHAALPSDPALPDLAALFREQTMRPVLQRCLSAGDVDATIASARIVGARYQPGKRCIVSYRVTGSDSERHLLVAELNSGRAGMRSWRFPDDPVLKGLHQPQRGSRKDIDVVLHAPTVSRQSRIAMQAVRYEPRKHCVLVSVDINGQPRMVAKVLSNASGARTRAAWAALGTRNVAAEPTLHCPELLAFEPATSTLWLQWCEGEPLSGYAGRAGLIPACERAAEAIVALHCSQLAAPARFDLQRFKTATLSRCESLAHAYPACRDLLTSLQERLRREFDDSPAMGMVPTHGDINPSQLLVRGEAAVVLDLDTLSMAEPLLDLAHFIAGLHRMDSSDARIEEGISCLLQQYRSKVGWEVPRRRLNDYVAAVLIYRTAYKVLRRLFPNGAASVDRYARLAMRYLDN
jgi:hypothetical protein